MAQRERSDTGCAAPPPVTIITPVHNGGHYVAETIESVLRQEYEGLEYIVLDDGSTDDTIAQIERFRPRLRLYSHANVGEARTVNIGVQHALSDIIAVVNADDPILPGLVHAAVSEFELHPDLVGLYPDWLKIDEAGVTLREVRTLDFDYSVLLSQNLCIPGPGAFFRRSTLSGELARNPGFRYGGDYDFWLRLGLRGRISRLPLTLATWRHHPTSSSQRYCNAEMALEKIAIIEAFFARPDLPQAVRELEAQARSAAYFAAALLGLRGDDVPSARLLLRSFLAKPRWRRPVVPQQRRSIPHVLYLLGQPLSGRLHTAIDRFLPHRYQRSAVLRQRFGERNA